jgi:N-acetylneuraminic acid mutarotase
MFLAILAASASALGTWKELAPLPEATEGLSTARVGTVIVGAYGYTLSGDSNQTLVYNITTNSWLLGAAAPGIASSEGIGVADKANVYALGGRNGAGTDNNRYTPGTNTWMPLAPMPTGRDGLGAAIIGKSIYAIGGRAETAGPCTGGAGMATVERYSISTNTWSAVAPLPISRSDVGAIAYRGKVYVFGGCNESGVTGEVGIYDPKTNTWSLGAPMPTPRAAFYGIGIKKANIYVIGGEEPSGATSPVNEVYNTVTNTWSADTPMLHPRGEMGVASKGKIYTMGGGLPGFGTPQVTNDVFTP